MTREYSREDDVPDLTPEQKKVQLEILHGLGRDRKEKKNVRASNLDYFNTVDFRFCWRCSRKLGASASGSTVDRCDC